MSQARRAFLERLIAFEAALEDQNIVQRAPSDHSWNIKAQLLRNGLAVVCFSILENFLRERTTEILKRLTSANIAFRQLPNKLHEYATLYALEAAAFQLKQHDAQRDDISYVQNIARQISSTAHYPFEFCEIAFGYSSFNLSESQIEKFLLAFGVEKPWETIGVVAASARVGSLKTRGRSAYEALARRRHSAAHNPNTNVQPSDLKASFNDAFSIALAYDVILSLAALKIVLHNASVPVSLSVKHGDIFLLFLQCFPNGIFKMFDQGKARARKISKDRSELLSIAREEGGSKHRFLIHLDERGFSTGWDVPLQVN